MVDIKEINGIRFMDYHDDEFNIHIRKEIPDRFYEDFIYWSIKEEAKKMRNKIIKQRSDTESQKKVFSSNLKKVCNNDNK